jgi:hypothetical protein
MKVGNFITHTLIFLAAWFSLAVWSWGSAQALSQTQLMPWVLPTVSLLPSTVSFAIGAAVAILGSCLAALVLLVVLLALEAIWHFLRGQLSAIQS